MAMADGCGNPISVVLAPGTAGEAGLVEKVLENRFTRGKPERIIGDKAYDSTGLGKKLRARGIKLIAPQIATPAGHDRSARRRRQDGRALRRYGRRWKVERLWAWLLRYRRISTRHERNAQTFLGFVLLACIILLARRLEHL